MRRRTLRSPEPIAALCMSSDVARCGRSVRSPVDPRAAASDAHLRLLANLQDRPRRQRDKLARNRDSGTAKSRDACVSATFAYGLRARYEYFCSAHRGTSSAFGAAIRGAIDSWSESLRAGIACAAKRHAHSLQFSFPTPANADKPLVLSLPGELYMSRSLPTAG